MSSSSEKKMKKDKEIVLELETQIKGMLKTYFVTGLRFLELDT